MGGGLLTLWPGVGTADGEGVLVPAANDVRVYNFRTGKLGRLLSGHSNLVTCTARHPTINTQVFTGGLDGTLRLWDLAAGDQLEEYDVGLPVFSMAICGGGRYAFLMLQSQDGSGSHAGSGEQGDLLPSPDTIPTPAPLADAGLRQASADGGRVATFEQHRVLVWASNAWQPRALELHIPKTVSCLALDGTGDMLATGDVTGRINLFRGLWPAVQAAQADFQTGAATSKRRRTRPPHTTLHWHAHTVGALCFSPDGEWLLSGGLEAVLVKWRLRGTGNTFLPRLGGPISCIDACPADPALYVVTQADNTLRLINMATSRALGTIYGIRPVPRLPPGYRSRAILLPGSGNLVLPAPNAQLQFYNPLEDYHVNKLSTNPRNPVSLTEMELEEGGAGHGPPLQPVVALLASSADGTCLATVDLRPDVAEQAVGRGRTAAAATLQFWERSPVEVAGPDAPCVPVTQILDPHRGRVTDLAFHPTDALAVTTSDCGEFKIWTQAGGPDDYFDENDASSGREPGAGQDSDPSTWCCRSVGSFRGLPCQCAAFSADGSLLCVGTGDLVTLWDPWENTLLGTLQPPLENKGCPISRVAFVPGTPFLVASSQGCNASLMVWNLLEMRISWSLGVPVSDLAADPEGHFFAVSMSAAEKAPGPAAPAVPQGTPEGDESGDMVLDKRTSNRALHDEPSGGKLAVCGAQGAVAAAADTVLLFEVTDPVPFRAWALPRGRAATLLFAPPGTRLAALSAPGQPSPLLVLTQDREYDFLIAVPEEARAVPLGLSDEGVQVNGNAGSVYDALFGPLTAPGKGSEEEVGTDGSSPSREAKGLVAVPQNVGPPAWLELMDGPVHAMPPLSVLCPAYLDLRIEAGSAGS